MAGGSSFYSRQALIEACSLGGQAREIRSCPPLVPKEEDGGNMRGITMESGNPFHIHPLSGKLVKSYICTSYLLPQRVQIK